MYRKKDIKPLAVFLLLFAYAVLGAQGWEKTFGDTVSDVSNDFVQTADNGWVMAGSSANSVGGDRDFRLWKTDVDGSLQRHRSFGTPGVEDFSNAIFQLPDGSFLVAGTSGNSAATVGTIWRVNSDFDSMWVFSTPEDSVILRDIVQTAGGNITAVGKRKNDAFVVEIDQGGGLIRTDTIGGTDLEDVFKIEAMPDSGFLMIGYTHSGQPSVDAWAVRYDKDNALVWEGNYGSDVEEEQALCITSSLNGGWYLAGFSDGSDNDDEDIWLAEIDSNGILLFDTTLIIAGLEKARSIVRLSDGNLLIAGDQRANTSSDANAILVKTDPFGSIIWTRNYGGVGTDIANELISVDASNYFTGVTSSFGAGSFDAWLVKTDAEGNSFSALLEGNVFEDFDLDCQPDLDEKGMKNWLLEVSGDKTFYASTDTSGNYEINIDTGDYIVHLVIPNPYWSACVNDVPISILNTNDTVSLDFPIQSASDCSFLTVDISTPFLRRCFPNTYVVSYCNSGTETAFNSEVTLEFDPFLIIDSSSVLLTNLGGNRYSFGVGDLEPFDCGTFKIHTRVFCDSMGGGVLLGQTHCSSARIYPDTFCLPPAPGWDGSSIDLDAFCDGDSVSVKIANTTGMSMAVQSDFIIIEDEILTRVIPIDLGGNEDTTIIIRPKGQTVRFEIDQSPGHPGNSKPSISVEGCGHNANNPFSLGYVIQFPQDDGDNFVEIDCQENIGAYDPNDKRGFPKGYDSTFHWIENDTELEYHIRFQNTGTDTAFTVVIRDTLAAEIDPTSIKSGVSSHPYEFELYDGGIVKFTFNDIMLPDSNVNEVASHGFVRFKASLKDSLDAGTIVYNDADIYFDFNPPVITNETFHRIGMNFVTIDPTIPASSVPLAEHQIVISPNPFSDQMKIELKDVLPEKRNFLLFNVSSQLLREASFTENEFIFHKGNLPKGIYIFNIKNRYRELIASGKIVLQ